MEMGGRGVFAWTANKEASTGPRITKSYQTRVFIIRVNNSINNGYVQYLQLHIEVK
jgi:hypothetical protein